MVCCISRIEEATFNYNESTWEIQSVKLVSFHLVKYILSCTFKVMQFYLQFHDCKVFEFVVAPVEFDWKKISRHAVSIIYYTKAAQYPDVRKIKIFSRIGFELKALRAFSIHVFLCSILERKGNC